MPTEEKKVAVQELAELFKETPGIYLADFSGLDVISITQMRKRLREESISFKVIKNRLALLATKEAGISGLDEMLQGPTGLAYCDGDPVSPARVLSDFAANAAGRPRLKAGYVDGEVYVEERLEKLAKLPTKDVLLTQLVTGIQSPISGLAFCLGGILQKLVGTLYAVAQKQLGEGGENAV